MFLLQIYSVFVEECNIITYKVTESSTLYADEKGAIKAYISFLYWAIPFNKDSNSCDPINDLYQTNSKCGKYNVFLELLH